MKIIFIDWHCFNREETVHAFESMGHEVIRFSHPDYNATASEEFHKYFKEAARAADACFSYNYFPVVAESCRELNLNYISVTYDSPYVYIYSFTLMYPTNHVFLFDSSWVAEMNAGGLKNVHYLVLPGNTAKLDAALEPSERTKSDISFVGALYNEAHNFYDRFCEKAIKADPALVGYVDGIIEAQSKIYGQPLLKELMTQDLIDRMWKYLPLEPDRTCVEPFGYRYISYFLERRLTSLERMRYLTGLGESTRNKNKIKLFTIDPKIKIPGIVNCGVAEYEHEMAAVFRDSRINLNISLRSIHTGIPLRCMDIMACGGFLLTNYQADFEPYFIAGEDYDYYAGTEDLMAKCEYYLSHEAERKQIAEKGHEKVKRDFTLEAVLKRTFKESGLW